MANELMIIEDEQEYAEQPKQNPVEFLRSVINLPNIIPQLDKEVVDKIGQEVVRGFDLDKGSRADWEKQTKIAMDLAKQVVEEKSWPWPKAANIKYPLITTAAIQFSARAYPAIVQGSDVVKGEVVGPDPDGMKKNRAERIGHHMSYQILEEMKGWDEEEDKLLLQMAIVGCAFRKTYFDTMIGRNCSDLVSAMDLVYDHATPWEKLRRKTHCLNLFKNEVIERVRGGIFTDIELGMPEGADNDEDCHYEFLECHTWYDLDGDGYKEPYICTVKKDTAEVFRIIARFDEEGIYLNDQGEIAKIKPVEYFTKFAFMPNPDGGSYDIGFGLLLNPVNEAINTVFNQMLDAGTLANTGGGFIGGGLKMKSGAVRFMPGEFKPVDVVSGRMADNIYHMQFPGPSSVLFQLLGMLIQAGKEMSSVQDIMTGEQQANQTATTTMALIEQGQKVFSAIYKRVHRAHKEEFKKLYRLNKLYLQPEDYYRFQDKVEPIYLEDYQGDDTDVTPVSDPSLVSDAQLLKRAEALLQFAQDPMMNQLEIRKNYLKAIKVQNPEAYISEEPQVPPQVQEQMQQMQIQLQEMGAKLQEAESGMAKAQMEMQGKMQMAQVDAQLEEQRQMRELQFKRELAEMEIALKERLAMLDAQIESAKQQNAVDLKAREALLKADTEQANIQVAREKIMAEIASKLEIARMNNESAEEIAKLNACMDVMKTHMGMMKEDLMTDRKEEYDTGTV